MPYIIDGNNVMAVLHRDVLIARRLLMSALSKFIAVHKIKTKVVFDGVPDDEYPDNISKKSVRIMYAKPGSDADSRIKEIVNKASYRRDITVVSSDKALISYVRGKGTKSLSSYQFRDVLKECEQIYATRDKSGQLSVDLDDWLDYFAADSGKGV